MPTTPTLDALSLRSPDALLAALPFLLGFHPARSAVFIWLAARRILLTQRIDLPAADADLDAWRGAVWSHPAADEADELIVVLVTAHPSWAELARGIRDEADERGIHLRDLLRSDAGRWWSLLCDEPTCCPPEGRVVDTAVVTEVGAEFALLGRAPAADRAALVAEMAPDPAAAVTPEELRAARAPIAVQARERWRDAAIAAIEAHLHDVAEADPVIVIAGLADIRVRDTVLWDALQLAPERSALAVARLVGTLRRTPEEFVAPVATTVAVLAWAGGDGARALVALDRALAADGTYSLAGLVAESLRAGLPPAVWREAMARVDRDECRHGMSTDH